MVTHIAAVTIDPACDAVRTKEYYSQTKPIFDRKKQAHVIQNQRCFLCDVKVYVHPKNNSNAICVHFGIRLGQQEDSSQTS